MKRIFLAIGAVLAGSLLTATELAINEVTAGTLVDAQELTLPTGTSVGEKATVVISATMQFTLPAETPDYAAAVSTADKLVIVADAKGELLLADGATGAWRKSGVTVAASDVVQVRAVGALNEDKRLLFDVDLTVAGATTTVKGLLSPASDVALNALAFEGEGEASAVSVAMVSTEILPAGGDAQDAKLVSAYLTWINGVGAAMAGAAADVQQAAFAMNVGGTPSLEITAIDPVARTITVVGSSGEQEADLNAINGTLYLTWSSELGGTATHTTQGITITGGKATVTFPADARFLKAQVTLTAPTDEKL